MNSLFEVGLDLLLIELKHGLSWGWAFGHITPLLFVLTTLGLTCAAWMPTAYAITHALPRQVQTRVRKGFFAYAWQPPAPRLHEKLQASEEISRGGRC